MFAPGRECFYWPGMNAEIKNSISRCDVCRSCDTKQAKETLYPHEVPDRPWVKVAVDLFEFNSRNYLITVDYYSGFWEVDPLEYTKTNHGIHKMKMQFGDTGFLTCAILTMAPSFSQQSTRGSVENGSLNSLPHHQRTLRATVKQRTRSRRQRQL